MMFGFVGKALEDVPCISFPKMIVLSIVLSIIFAYIGLPVRFQEATGLFLWIWWLTSYFNFRECKSQV